MEEKVTFNKNERIKFYLKWALVLVLPLIVYFIIPANSIFTVEMRMFIAITLGAVLLWAMNLMPVYISGLLLTMLFILLKVAPQDVVLAPWTGSVVWLTLGGLTISMIFEKSGLMERIASYFIAKVGGTYKGIVIGLVLSGIVVGLLVPNMTGRVALYSALSYGIYNTLNLKNNSNTAAGIMFAGFVAAIAPAWMYLSASENLQLINSYLRNSGNHVTWLEYFKSNGIIMLLWTLVLLTMILIFYKEDDKIEKTDYFDKKVEEMGKMSTREKKFIWILILLVTSIIFVDIDAGWLFILAVIACFLPGIEIVTMDDIKSVNYSMVFFVAATMSIGSVSNSVGVVEAISELLIPLMSGIGDFGIMVFSWILGVIADLMMTPLAGMAAFVPVLIEVASELGLSPIGTSFAFTWGVEQLFFPYEWALFLILFGYNVFDMKKAIKFGTLRTILSFIFLIAIIIPVWIWTGFL